MATPETWDVVRLCFLGDGRSSLADRIAILAAWCLALAVLLFNAFFGLLFEDGNLLVRGVITLVLSAPLLGLYARGKRAVRAQKAA
jgi:hypothetical protein